MTPVSAIARMGCDCAATELFANPGVRGGFAAQLECPHQVLGREAMRSRHGTLDIPFDQATNVLRTVQTDLSGSQLGLVEQLGFEVHYQASLHDTNLAARTVVVKPNPEVITATRPGSVWATAMRRDTPLDPAAATAEPSPHPRPVQQQVPDLPQQPGPHLALRGDDGEEVSTTRAGLHHGESKDRKTESQPG